MMITIIRIQNEWPMVLLSKVLLFWSHWRHKSLVAMVVPCCWHPQTLWSRYYADHFRSCNGTLSTMGWSNHDRHSHSCGYLILAVYSATKVITNMSVSSMYPITRWLRYEYFMSHFSHDQRPAPRLRPLDWTAVGCKLLLPRSKLVAVGIRNLPLDPCFSLPCGSMFFVILITALYRAFHMRVLSTGLPQRSNSDSTHVPHTL